MTQANKPPEVNPYFSPAGESAETVRFQTPAASEGSLLSVFFFLYFVVLGFLLIPIFFLSTFLQTSGLPPPQRGKPYPDWLMQIAADHQRANRWDLIKLYIWSLLFAAGFTILFALCGVSIFLLHFVFGLGWWLSLVMPGGILWVCSRFSDKKKLSQRLAQFQLYLRSPVAEQLVPWNADTKRFQLAFPAVMAQIWGAEAKFRFRTVNPSGVVVECQDSASTEVLQQSNFPHTAQEGWTEVPSTIAFSLEGLSADEISKRNFVVYSQDDYPWIIPGA